jgi:hypothetical protein
MIQNHISNLSGDDGEFAADKHSVERGFGVALKESLEFNTKEFPQEYDKKITRDRLRKIDQQLYKMKNPPKGESSEG